MSRTKRHTRTLDRQALRGCLTRRNRADARSWMREVTA
jgi:hypothetical protein